MLSHVLGELLLNEIDVEFDLGVEIQEEVPPPRRESLGADEGLADEVGSVGKDPKLPAPAKLFEASPAPEVLIKSSRGRVPRGGWFGSR